MDKSTLNALSIVLDACEYNALQHIDDKDYLKQVADSIIAVSEFWKSELNKQQPNGSK